jgi:hypothetical protein
METRINEVYEDLKHKRVHYNEEVHCKLILRVMMTKGRLSTFCVAVKVSDRTAYHWMEQNPLFAECYALGKMYARENWEEEGYELRLETTPLGMLNHAFEHWKMVGWSRFGVGSNPRIKLNLDPDADPSKHYVQLLKQASEGEYPPSDNVTKRDRSAKIRLSNNAGKF